MSMVKMWRQGQLTIPSSFRKELGIEEESILSLVKVGSSLLLTSKPLQGDVLAGKMEVRLRKKKLSLEDILRELKAERLRYNKDVHGL